MGQYWTLSIKGYSVLEGKNYFDGTMLQLFRQEDAKIKCVHSEHTECDRYRTYEYTSRVVEMRERLDLMGFSVDRTARDFERGRQRELGENDEPSSEYARFLSGYSFSKWLSVMGSLIRSGEQQYIESAYPHVGSAKEFICSFDNDNALLGFFNSDPRFVLRGCLEAAAPQARVRHRVVSLLKRWLLGTHQGAIGQEHLNDYLDEYTFRFNRRKSASRGKLFYRLIQQAVQVEPAPYRTITHPNL